MEQVIRRSLLVAGLAAVFLTSCRKEENLPQDLGTAYFPLRTGQWVEYQVDSVWRDDLLNVLDSVSYRLKERVEETYTDGSGRTAYRIKRYVHDEDAGWLVRDVWSAHRDQRYAEMTEENKRRLKLSFPVREARSWDLNVYNTDRVLEVAYREAHEPWTQADLVFDSTVVVRNVLPPNAVERRDFEERYAKHVGLVEKHWEETSTQFDAQSQQFVVRGFRLNMVVLAYGQD